MSIGKIFSYFSSPFRNFARVLQEENGIKEALEQGYGLPNHLLDLHRFISDLDTAEKDNQRLSLQISDLRESQDLGLLPDEITKIYKMGIASLLGTAASEDRQKLALELIELLTPHSDEEFRQIVTLSKSMGSPEETMSLLKLFKDIETPFDRRELLRIASPLLPLSSYPWFSFQVLESLEKTKPEARENLAHLAKDLLKGIEEGSCSLVFDFIKTLSDQAWNEILPRLKPLIDKFPSSVQRVKLMEFASTTPDGEWNQIVPLVASTIETRSFGAINLLEGLRSQIRMILLHTEKMETEKRESAVSLTKEICAAIDPLDFAEFLQFVAQNPLENVLVAFERSLPLIKESAKNKTLGILRIALPITSEKWERASSLISEMDVGYLKGYSKGIFIKVLQSVPIDQWDEIVDYSKPFLKKNFWFEGVDCLKILPSLEKEKRKAAAEFALRTGTPLNLVTLFSPEEYNDDLAKALQKRRDGLEKVLELIPEEKRAFALLQALSLIKKGDPDWLTFATIYLSSLEGTKEVLEKPPSELFSPQCFKLFDNRREKLLRTLCFAAFPKQLQTTELARELEVFFNAPNRSSALWTLKLLAKYPDETLTPSLVYYLTSINMSNQLINMGWILGSVSDDRENSSLINFIPPSKFKEAIKVLEDSPELAGASFRNFLIKLFQDPDWLEEAKGHVTKLLETPLSPAEIWRLSQAVIETADDVWGLTEIDPFLMLAFERASISDPDVKVNKKNPYRIYQEHIKNRALEPSPVDIQTEEIDQKRVRWNVDFLRLMGQPKNYTYGDIDKSVTKATVENIFQGLQRRSSKHLKDYILHSTSYTLEQHQDNMLGKLFIPGLLMGSGNNSQPISLAKLQLFTILKAIQDQSHEIPPGALLSPREEMFLKISASVQNCKTGQGEGLSLAYQLLDPKYRKFFTSSKNSSGEAVAEVGKRLQGLMGSNFADIAFLKKASSVYQDVHASLYIKNLIAHLVGYEHLITFDPYTGALDGNLVEKSPEELARLYFEHFPIQKAVDQLVSESKRFLNEGHSEGVAALLIPYKLEGQTVEHFIDEKTDEEGNDYYQLNPKGALTLLIASKFVTLDT